MNDLIRRQDAINAMYQLEAEDIEAYGCFIPEGFHANQAVEALEALPSAYPERKKGKWIEINGTSSFIWLRCSECGYGANGRTNFCPNCGAEMSEVNDGNVI